jgi:hypothetical protein
MPLDTNMKTIDWLKDLASRNTSTEEDERIMLVLLHKFNFPNARIVYGIVYIDGKGAPSSIQAVAQAMIEGVAEVKAKKAEKSGG